jgi:hypothetical protein
MTKFSPPQARQACAKVLLTMALSGLSTTAGRPKRMALARSSGVAA